MGCVISGTSPAIGSVSKLYDLLEQAAIETPVVGNQGGSYLTMKSNQGLVFGAVTVLSGFTGVFCDQGWPFVHAILLVRISLMEISHRLLAKGEGEVLLYDPSLSEVGNSKPSGVDH